MGISAKMVLGNLKEVLSDPQPCKICGGASPLFGVVDFHKSCEELRGKFLPLSGVPIYYRRCGTCGFLFSDSFDNWSPQEFGTYIYNAGYEMVDPDYARVRPDANAQMLIRAFERSKGTLRVLDYGGGNGAFAAALRAGGFLAADTYDPLVSEHSTKPHGCFDVVTSFETLEHHPRPLAAIEDMAEHTEDSGLVIFSTLVQPADLDQQGMGWWYIGPRNGHISLFTSQSLAKAWNRLGFMLRSSNENLHIAFRKVPDFGRHLFTITS